MTETITIQGYEFPVQPRYKAGHTLTDLEAEALNQAYWDNLRNNFTNKVKAAKSQSGGLSDATHQDLVRQFEGYAQDYQFGQRRAAADPIHAQIEAQALSLARTAIRDVMREQGKKDTYTAEQVEEAAEALVRQDPTFTEKAEKAVAERRTMAEAALRALQQPDTQVQPAPRRTTPADQPRTDGGGQKPDGVHTPPTGPV